MAPKRVSSGGRERGGSAPATVTSEAPVSQASRLRQRIIGLALERLGMSLGDDAVSTKLWNLVDSASERSGKWKMPEQGESGLDWASLTGIDEALKSGARIYISSGPEHRLGKLDTSKKIMTVQVSDRETHNIITMGQNSYVEGAIRDADNKLKDPSLAEVNSSDEPPTQESLLNWFVRLGGSINIECDPQGIINLDFSIVGAPLQDLARVFDHRGNVSSPWAEQNSNFFWSMANRLTESITHFVEKVVIYRCEAGGLSPSDVFASLPSDDSKGNNPPGIDLDQIYQFHLNALAGLPD